MAEKMKTDKFIRRISNQKYNQISNDDSQKEGLNSRKRMKM